MLYNTDTSKNTSCKNFRTYTQNLLLFRYSLLRQLRVEQAKKSISAYVFTQEASPEPMHPQSPTRYLKKFSVRYGVADLHPHKLRHTFASVANFAKIPLLDIGKALGHKDVSITGRIYTHLFDQTHQEVVSAVAAQIKA